MRKRSWIGVWILALGVVASLEAGEKREPLALKGEAPSREEIDAAVKAGVEYLLSKQMPDGSWHHDYAAPGALYGEDAVGDGAVMIGLTQTGAHPQLMTAYACLALREHREADPDRIREAVDRGRTFLLKNSASRQQRAHATGGPWGLVYPLRFLCKEYEECKADEPQKKRLRREIQRLVNAMLRVQREGGGGRTTGTPRSRL